MNYLHAGYCGKCESGRYFQLRPTHYIKRYDNNGRIEQVARPAGLYCRSCNTRSSDIRFRDIHRQRGLPTTPRAPRVPISLKPVRRGMTRTGILR